jgi:hypothetical protein
MGGFIRIWVGFCACCSLARRCAGSSAARPSHRNRSCPLLREVGPDEPDKPRWNPPLCGVEERPRLRLLCGVKERRGVEEDIAARGNQPRGYCRGGGGARRGRRRRRRRAGHPRARSRTRGRHGRLLRSTQSLQAEAAGTAAPPRQAGVARRATQAPCALRGPAPVGPRLAPSVPRAASPSSTVAFVGFAVVTLASLHQILLAILLKRPALWEA